MSNDEDLLSEGLTPEQGLGGSFAAGQVVAGRFRIERSLGRGGMGEVYEAIDLELRERVALKALQASLAKDERVTERFRREIQLARKVTHVNVCRTFDAFRHRVAAAQPEITFVTMELLAGETLFARLRRDGPLTVRQAVPLVRQMAAGLAAAHQAGVVHRDFKSSNVMLVPSSQGGTRAVVTDFGLAQSADSALLTSSGLIVGTPAYLAPEQVEGRGATPSSDVYALGIVMYEMVTGRTPFMADSPVTAAVMRLSTPPRRPRELVPDLDPRFEQVVLRCLEREPADRFPSAEDVVHALDGLIPAARPCRPRWWLLAAAGLGALVTAGALLELGVVSRPPTAAPMTGPPQRTVAVLGFHNLTGRADTGWLSMAFAEMLTTELAAGEALRVLPGEAVARLKSDLSLSAAEAFTPETLDRIRRHSSSDLVVLGSYLAQGPEGSLRLDLRVQDTWTGGTVVAMAETGATVQVIDLVARAGARLRDRLGERPLTAAQTEAVRASRPRGPAAAHLYAEGLELLRRGENVGAKDTLLRAVKADSGFALARWALARAWSGLAQDAFAAGEAKRALDLAGALPREEGLQIEAEYHRQTGEWDKAAATYALLLRLEPENVDHGLAHVQALRAAGRHEEVRAAIERLRRLPLPAGDDPRIDLARILTLGDPRARFALAEQVARTAEARRMRHVFAEARFRQAQASHLLGELVAARGRYAEALRVFEALGSPVWIGLTLNNIGLIQSHQGDFAGALANYQRLVDTGRQSGSRYLFAGLLNAADVRMQLGDLRKAEKAVAEALRLATPFSDKDPHALAALLAAIRGRPREARIELEKATTERTEGPFAALTAGVRGADRAQVELVLGEAEAARRHFTEAIQSFRSQESREFEVLALTGLAEAALQVNEPAAAESAAREAAAMARRLTMRPTEAQAEAVLCQAQAAQRRAEEATQALQRARSAAQGIESVNLAYALEVAEARLLAASGSNQEAVRRLEAVVARSARLGFVTASLAARLAAGEIESGAARRARLSGVAAAASAKGLTAIAERAERLLRG